MAFLTKRLMAAATLTMSVALGGCMGDYGYGGIGYASDYYDGYGYGPGYAYNDGYGYGAFGGGWYNDFYYPGTGIYVFDRGGRRSRWNDTQRRYWQSHGHDGRGSQGGGRSNWRPDRGPRQGWRDDRRGGFDRGQIPGGQVNGQPNGQWRGRTPGTQNGGQNGWRGRNGGAPSTRQWQGRAPGAGGAPRAPGSGARSGDGRGPGNGNRGHH